MLIANSRDTDVLVQDVGGIEMELATSVMGITRRRSDQVAARARSCASSRGRGTVEHLVRYCGKDGHRDPL